MFVYECFYILYIIKNFVCEYNIQSNTVQSTQILPEKITICLLIKVNCKWFAMIIIYDDDADDNDDDEDDFDVDYITLTLFVIYF